MPRTATVPFQIARSDQVIAGGSVTTTTESVEGLLRLEGAVLTVQWRVTQVVKTVGAVIREDRAVAGVRELTVSINGLTAASVKPRWWQWGRKARLVLTAPDLHRFEAINGPAGLLLEHPAQLVLDIRKSDQLAAQEFVAELELAVAELGEQATVRSGHGVMAMESPRVTGALPAPSSDGAR